ncbi:MAG: guanylate kinase [Candidatus Cloacimonetes bacterium]|nr:guanylate kinase [Candidatus Cloacimonadota bacterium]MDD4155690.1 guanylate kinase [Candidatus Cloacimonadota bacterium]
MKKNGFLITLASPSGGGKSTICKQLMNKVNNLKYSISWTTRAIRVNEEDGKDYFFTSIEDFKEKQKKNFFLESANVHDNWYGTSYEFIDNCLKNEEILLLDIDVQGVEQIRKQSYNIVSIFILPPTESELRERLINRKTDSKETIKKRLSNAKTEIKYLPKYDYLVINDTIENAVNNIISIINAEKLKVERYIEPIKSFYNQRSNNEY